MSDPRVEVMARAIWLGDYDQFRMDAVGAGITALEAAGYTIAKLGDTGWVCLTCSFVGHEPDDCGCGPDRDCQPLYRIIPEGEKP